MGPFELVVSCEHASHALPAGLDLGVSLKVLRSHVSWDPGAREIAVSLAEAYRAPVELGQYSRLVVDLNRMETNPEVVPHNSFGTVIPGNQNLSLERWEERLALYHRPYRRRVLSAVQAMVGRGARCLHMPIHTFTPVLGSEVRDVEIGILYDPSRMMEQLAADMFLDDFCRAGLVARPNEPYLGTDDGINPWLRASYTDEFYAGVELETSQALVESEGGIERVLNVLRPSVQRVLKMLSIQG